MGKILSILFVFFALNSFSANVHVRDGGTGDGSAWDNALDDLPANLTRGNTYYLGDGVYADHTFDEPLSGTTLIIIKKAVASDHGTETGWLSTYGDGEAIFEGRCWTFGASGGTYGYITIDGQHGTLRVPGSYGIRIRTTASESRANTTMLFLGGDVTALNNVSILNVEADFNDGEPAIDTNISGYVGFFSPCNNLLFQNNYVHHSTGAGIFVREGANPWNRRNMTNVSLVDVVFENMGGGGGNVPGMEAHWEVTWLTGIVNLDLIRVQLINLFGPVNGQTGGLMIGGNDNVRIVNFKGFNEIGATQDGQGLAVGNDGYIASWNGLPYENTGISIIGSSFIDLPSNARVDFTDSTNFTNQNNLYYTAGFTVSGATVNSHNAFGGGVTAFGTSTQTGLTTAIFNDYANDDFTLASGTTAGVTLASPFDIDGSGETRGVDGVWDRGWDEFNSGGGGTTGSTGATFSSGVSASNGVTVQ